MVLQQQRLMLSTVEELIEPKQVVTDELPESQYLQYNLTVTDETGEVIREMEILKPQDVNSFPEKIETLEALQKFMEKVNSEPDPVTFLHLSNG